MRNEVKKILSGSGTRTPTDTYLYACICRAATQKLRDDFLGTLTTTLAATFPDKTRSLSLVSFASGGLQEESRILQALGTLKYSTVHLHLIDPLYALGVKSVRDEMEKLADTKSGFREYLAEYPKLKLAMAEVLKQTLTLSTHGTKVQIKFYRSITHFEESLKDGTADSVKTGGLVAISVDWPGQSSNDLAKCFQELSKHHAGSIVFGLGKHFVEISRDLSHILAQITRIGEFDGRLPKVELPRK